MRPVEGINPIQRDRLRILMVTARSYPFVGGVEAHLHEVAWSCC
jgi:hypothetical protein